MESVAGTTAELYDRALAAHQAGRLDEAIAGYRQVVSLDSGNKIALNNLGTALKAQGKLEDAILAYESAVVLDRTYVAALYNLGTAHHAKGDLPRALSCYLEVSRISPNDVNNWYNMALVSERFALYGLATDMFQKVLQLDPTRIPARAGLARTLSLSGEHVEAMQHFERILQEHPEQPAFWKQWGDAYVCIGEYTRAIECLKTASTLLPQSIEMKIELGRNLFRIGEYEATVSLCRETINQFGLFGPAVLMMAAAQRQLGHHVEAEANEKVANSLPATAMHWLHELMDIPTLPFDRTQIEQIRDKFFSLAREAEAYGGKMADPTLTVNASPFYFAYHGCNDRPLMERLAEVVLRMSPDLAWEAPHTRRH